MKAAIINYYGPPDAFQYTEVEQPALKPDQLLVQVHATSVNPIDWKIRKGLLKLLTGSRFPMILGRDLAGDVVAVGDRVTQFKPGDAVYGQLTGMAGGAYADYAAVSEQAAVLKPSTMTYEQAAAVPLAAMTALQALRDKGNLKPGQKVLINGASGGVGTFAVQLANVLGAEVTAVCSGRNAALVKELGADRVIDYTQQDFTQDTVIYDLVFDVVGNRSLAECRSVLQPRGVYVTTQPYPKDFLRSIWTWLKPGPTAKVILEQPNSRDLAYLREQIEAGTLRSVIDRTFSLADIAAAHEYSETERATGKIVITVPH
jgi:NADPH:quinone reductase-like Zn-dependent oxidoreductase